jgi:hypothetical protein
MNTRSTAGKPKSPKQKVASQRLLPTPPEDLGFANWTARPLPQTSEVEILGMTDVLKIWAWKCQQGFDDPLDEEGFLLDTTSHPRQTPAISLVGADVL